MNRIAVGILVFVILLACIVGLGFGLHFEGTRLILFCVLLGILAALAVAFAVWYQGRLNSENAPASDTGGPDAVNLNAMLRDADRKLRANLHGVKSFVSAPLIYMLGDENSAKTQTVVQSGLDAELLAGNLYRDGIVAPTQFVNLWLAGSAVIVEAGGALIRQPALWSRLIRATQPGRVGSALSRDARQPTRAAVLCVSIERLPGPSEPGYNADHIRSLGQTMNQRLRELSQTLGITLPVYVLFTKLDTLPHFADFAGRLTTDEIKAPLGTLLSPLEAGSGLYAERAAALVSARFDELTFTLSEFRINALSRSAELKTLASAYEFPRDLQKKRASIVDFLVELTRPSQLGINPFLRGFFFSGMRAVMEDIAQAPQIQQAEVKPFDAGATRVFSIGGAPMQQPAPAPARSGTRRVPQWVFLPHLFSKVLLADDTALEVSRVSTRVHLMKRILLATCCFFVFLFLILSTISFFNNRDLEQQVASAAELAVASPAPGQFATLNSLQNLDKLGTLLLRLDGYRKNGVPLMYGWGLYSGNRLYPVACADYSVKFRALLLNQAQANILAQFHSLQSPPPKDADYNATYRPLKAYLITTSNPDKSTVDFLPPVLTAAWSGTTQVPSDVAHLAQTQFETYASLLPEPESCLAAAGGAPEVPTVERTRTYLNGFGGFEHVYQSMLAAASHKFPSIRYNEKFPGSSRYIVDNYEVVGALTKGGYGFMQGAIQHPDPYFSGEEWVLGPLSASTVDRTTLPGQLQKQYVADYLAAWRAYLNAARFTGFQNLADAALKLGTLDSNSSPILELFSLISINTAVGLPEIADAFQAPQQVVPPSSSEKQFIAPANQAYIQALQGLESSIKMVSENKLGANDIAAGQPILQAAGLAEQAAENLRNTFTQDAAGHMDSVSFARLEDPILAARGAAGNIGSGAANGGAKTFCAQAAPVLAKFPFNPQSTTEATADEAAQIFSPGQGALSALTGKISQMVVLQGGQYVSAPASTIAINPGFLSFLNAAQKVSSALFPAGGNQPTLSFSLAEVKTAGVADAVLNIDGQQLSAGQTTSFHWTSQPSSRITLVAEQQSAAPMTGPWSVFHFGFNANAHPTPTRFEYQIQFGRATGQPVRFDADGSGAALLDPKFMNRLHCVSTVAK